METTFSPYTSLPKEERYKTILPLIRGLIEGEDDSVSLLANVAAALNESFGWFWIGFYMVKDNQLHLGPFQGPVACTRIAKGKGVCGTAWAQAETQVVPDVELFPGHIACSSQSRSEIVVPIIKEKNVIGVLDIDSRELSTFDETDRKYLELLCKDIASQL
ncbi:MAG: GAF domain-containing protein [Bacteroidales bacterium]|nr:GAF domain-containing protein [Bacteroidales bacterium]